MLKIYDKSMSYSAAVTAEDSLDRIDRFSLAGEMTLTLPANDEAAGKIVPGCYAVTERGDLYCAESVRLNGDGMTAVFTGGAGLLRSCVAEEDQNLMIGKIRAASAIEQAVRSYAAGAFPVNLYIEKCSSSRKLRNIIRAGNLYDGVAVAMASSGLGVRIRLEAGTVVFALSEGRERDLIFWDAVGAPTLDYLTDVKNYCNRAVIRGDFDEDGSTRLKAAVTAVECEFDDGWDDGSWAARSVYVDAEDIKRLDYTTVVSESQGISFFDRSAYLSALKDRGAEVLAKMRPAVEVTLTLDTESDLRPGDIVTVRRRGVEGKKRVIVTELRRRIAAGKETLCAKLRVIA